jgi:hypothetical protein
MDKIHELDDFLNKVDEIGKFKYFKLRLIKTFDYISKFNRIIG